MASPGVSVRPIITLDGAHEVNDVFFDDVRVPVANRIGEEDRGWTYAKFLLGNERTSMASTPRSRAAIDLLKRVAAANRHGAPILRPPDFARKVARRASQHPRPERSEVRREGKRCGSPVRARGYP